MVIERGNGVRLTVRATGASDAYVRSVRLNGVDRTRSWLPESFVRDGGTVAFTLGAEADPRWGTAVHDLPRDHRARR